MRFDGLKKRAVRRNVNVLFLIQVLCAVYVILASVFVNVGTTGQAMIVPLFYFVRVACETYARTLPQHSTCTLLSQRRTSTERLIVPVFGSDAIPLITFFIVAFHETPCRTFCFSISLSLSDRVDNHISFFNSIRLCLPTQMSTSYQAWWVSMQLRTCFVFLV